MSPVPFAEAREIAESRPQPGSDQWHRWQQLSKIAMQANGDYIDELERFHKLSAHDHATAE